ncbi:MAG TPA: methyltransferase [Candidatus Acidoferrales bacterium]|nr:methyltransferase [Candidatus Acidoferrales bacterium]
MSSTEAARQPEPSQILFHMLTGAWIAQAISVVATLGIADLLADGPKDARQLALPTSTHADSLYRVMRALASSGVFLETEDRRFELTPVSECLRSDTPDSFRNAARMFGLPLFWRSWGEALQCVKTGETGLRRAFGLANPFSYLAEHSEDGGIFNNAMTEMSRSVGPAIAEAYDFGKFSKIVDAGGGHGSMLAAILRRYPGPRGVLFDLPNVVKDARPAIAAAGLADRCEIVAGDLFESVPPGADAYVLKAIIHGFQGERAVAILRNVRRAIAPEGRLFLVERVIPPGNAPSPNKLADLQMLVMSGGRERTPREFEELLGAGGFKLAKIHSAAALQSVVEGVPA